MSRSSVPFGTGVDWSKQSVASIEGFADKHQPRTLTALPTRRPRNLETVLLAIIFFCLPVALFGRTTSVVTWNTPAAISYGTALTSTQLNATATIPGTFAYSPVAGTILGAGAQTLSVTFTPTDTTDYSTATLTVTLAVKPATPTIAWARHGAIGYGTALGSAELDAIASVPGTYAYSPASGTVPTAGPQTLSVTFTPTDSIDYVSATATRPLTVKQATPTITWAAPAAIAFGTALSGKQLDASASVPGTFAYSPAAGTVLSAGVRTLSVTFTPTDASDYKSATASVSLTLSPGTPTISWATPSAIAYGTALSAAQLDATSTFPGTFTYSPAAGSVLGFGSQTLSVTFTPSDATNFTTVSATVALTVNKATPAISWATPATITSGTSLGSAQLNASTTAAGTFAYSPAAGTVPAVGSQTLTAIFTPTDTVDYNSASASVSLTVVQSVATLSINSGSVSFGSVDLGQTSTQTLTLSSTGNTPVTVNSAAVAGAGFTLPGSTLPVTLAPGQTTTLGVEFDPTAAGAASGTLTVNSTSSTGSTATVALSGTGTAVAYTVDLTWDAPVGSAVPVTGYNVYRAPSGSSTYQLVNSSLDASTSYVDTTVQTGATYDYEIESVDSSGVASAPTSPVVVVVP